jgi:hypothetical protein
MVPVVRSQAEFNAEDAIMWRTFGNRGWKWDVGLAFALGIATASQAMAGGDAPAKKLHGRLPPHYGNVVNENQRQAIYKIQEEYSGRIEALQTQLKNLKKQRDDRILAVVTPDQRRRIEAAKGNAGAKPLKHAPAQPAEKKPAP